MGQFIQHQMLWSCCPLQMLLGTTTMNAMNYTFYAQQVWDLSSVPSHEGNVKSV